MKHSKESTRLQALEAQLADLKARMPAHSIPPSMMMELDELEEELAEIRARRDEEGLAP